MCGILVIGTTYLFSKINLSKRKISVISTIFLFIFMQITGYTPSVVRACIMALLNLIARTAI